MLQFNPNDLAIRSRIEALQSQLANSTVLKQATQMGFSEYLAAQMTVGDAKKQSEAAMFAASAYLPSASTVNAQAYDWIGKNVLVETQAVDANGSNVTHQFTGVVQGVYVENGQTFLSVDGNRIDMAAIRNITELSSGVVGGLTDEAVMQGAALVGKTVTAQWTGSDGQQVSIEGVVQEVISGDDALYAVVNGTLVDLRSIQSISGGAEAAAYSASALTGETTANYSYAQYPVSAYPTSSTTGGVVMENTYSVTGEHSYVQPAAGYSLDALLALIANDPALLTDGEFEIIGQPDETGAFG